MHILKDNIIEILLLIGIINVSIGFFMHSTKLGFIGTGGMLLALALLILVKGGDI